MSLFAHFDVNLLLVAVTALSATLAFFAAIHLYVRCYLCPRRSGSSTVTGGSGFPNTTPPDDYSLQQVLSRVGGAAHGLDDKALRALPVFWWDSKKQAGEGGAQAADEPVQCAICLRQMVDGELGRLLPACRHVFHVVCIDKWFRMSTTCPVCRTTAEAAAANAPSAARERAQP